MMSNDKASDKARKADPEQADAEQAGSGQAGSGQAGSGRTEAGKTGEAAATGPDAEIGPDATSEGAAAAGPDLDGQVEVDEADTVARLEAEVGELKDRLMRALAENENVRRRAERERREAAAYGGTELARDLLAVYDNLERALGHADEPARQHAGAVIEGVELTRRELLSAFAKHRIEKFMPEKGEKFDPHFHQAMYEAPVPGAQPGTVIEAMQSGFTIADRLLRPALVGVAKKEPRASGEGDAQPANTPRPGDDSTGST